MQWRYLEQFEGSEGDPTTSDMSFVVLKNGIDRDLLGEVGFAID